MKLIKGDCLEEMKDLSDNSIDFLFADLPYGQTSCKWDCLIDLDLPSRSMLDSPSSPKMLGIVRENSQ